MPDTGAYGEAHVQRQACEAGWARSLQKHPSGLGRARRGTLGLFRSREAFFFPETRAWPVNLGISGGRLGCRQGVLPGQVRPGGLGVLVPPAGGPVCGMLTPGVRVPPHASRGCGQSSRRAAQALRGLRGRMGRLWLSVNRPPAAPQLHRGARSCVQSQGQSQLLASLGHRAILTNERYTWFLQVRASVQKWEEPSRPLHRRCGNPAGVLSSHPPTAPRSEVVLVLYMVGPKLRGLGRPA